MIVPCSGDSVTAGEHPALATDLDDVPTLTLVLPPGLSKDVVLAGLVQAIGEVRAAVAARVQLFQRRVGECAAKSDQLGQAVCRGQALGGEHAASAIDEAIVAVFDLWEQYETQLSAAGDAVPCPTPPGMQGGTEVLPQ